MPHCASAHETGHVAEIPLYRHPPSDSRKLVRTAGGCTSFLSLSMVALTALTVAAPVLMGVFTICPVKMVMSSPPALVTSPEVIRIGATSRSNPATGEVPNGEK